MRDAKELDVKTRVIESIIPFLIYPSIYLSLSKLSVTPLSQAGGI
jgi:hypothetical protein